jgi:hypothetical protein
VPPQLASHIRQPCQVVNRVPPKKEKGKWTDQSLEEVMEAIERGTHSLRKTNKSWNIPFNSLSDHLNGNTRNLLILFSHIHFLD